MNEIDDRPGFGPCTRPGHVPGCPGDAGGDHELAAPGRLCPACGILAAAPGDRYCADCGSASDRSAWVDGPGPVL